MRTNPTDGRSSGPLPVGYRLGEYTMVAVLGDGGFGMTYRARDTKLGVDVAIKEYFPRVYANRTAASTIVPKTGADFENYRWGLNAFLNEAQALAKFKHPQIVRVLRFLEANGTAYTIMEYEEGETLTAYLRRHGGALGEPRLLQIFLPILNGLQAVHEAGLLHLDIKPDNIYLRSNEQPMLIDFGSARQMRGAADGKVTLTPGYCALEQYPGHGATGAVSDVYGMGATLYRCVTGKNPVDALERQRVYERLHVDPLAPATSFERPLYSAHIRESIDRALKLTADERPPSAFALQQALMGKDLSKIAARPSTSLYRPGTGFIGVLPPPRQAPAPTARRYGWLEKLIAATVFVVTFAIITPKVLIDTGRLSESQLFGWIDHARNAIDAQATAFGDLINERVFGVKPRPKVATNARVRPRPAPDAPAPAPARRPFGADMHRGPDIVLPEPGPRALGFLRHGAVLAVVTAAGRLQLWDVASGAARTTLPTEISSAAALGIFPSSQWVAAMNPDRAIAVFDPLGNLEFTLVNDPPHAIAAMAVSTNALGLAELSADHRLTVWDLPQQRRRQTWETDKTTQPLLAFSPDERRLLTADSGGGVTVWRSTDGTRLGHWQAHRHAVVALAFAPNGQRLASADAAGEIRLWSPAAAGDAWQLARTVSGAPTRVTALSFSPDSEWLLGTGAGADVYIWDAHRGTLAQRLRTDRRALDALAVSDDGLRIAVAADDNRIRVWK